MSFKLGDKIYKEILYFYAEDKGTGIPQYAETEEGKYSYEQTPGQGGISIVFYQMDTGDEAFWMQDHYVTESENIQVGNHDGVYEKMQNIVGDDSAFDQMINIIHECRTSGLSDKI